MARAARDEGIGFAIGAKRIGPLWRLLDGIAEDDWHDAVQMRGAQVAVAGYCPDWWRATTRLALPFPEMQNAGAIYAYSFILTSLDVSEPGKAVAVEYWYRHRATVENVFRDSKHGAALRHLPSGHIALNTAWMWGALLAASMAGWLHQLTATTAGQAIVAGHGTRGGKAMIATLRCRLIAVHGRLICHAAQLILRLPPGQHGPDPEPGTREPGATPGPWHVRTAKTMATQISRAAEDQLRALLADSGLSCPERASSSAAAERPAAE